MPGPIIETCLSSKTPFQVYQSLYAKSKGSFFLDSPELNRNQRYSFLGCDPFFEVIVTGKRLVLKGGESGSYPAEKLLGVLRWLFKKYAFLGRQRRPFFTGGAVGYWGYETARLFERKVGFKNQDPHPAPMIRLGFYFDVMIYDSRKRCFFLVVNPYSPKQRKQDPELRSRLDRLRFFLKEPCPKPRSFSISPMRADLTQQEFETMVRRAQDYIAAGDIYQANLSQRFSFHYRGCPIAVYKALRRINPSPFSSFFKMEDLHIVSSSPERLILKKGRICETRPIAGTRPRQRKGLSPAQMTRELLASEKERAEHVMLVDLERNDLGRVCRYRSIRVEEMMTTERYSHVIHIVSKITGRLRPDKDAFDLIRAMFPGGTITGCPKVRCMQIIEELEESRRGIYTGSIGYIDFRQNLDLNIVIRTLILEKGKGFLQAGAGIVSDSKPSREYVETLDKAQALLEALKCASRKK